MRATLTIVDNDLPVVTIAADADVVGEDSGAAGFTLSRTGPTEASLTLTVTVTPEADRDLLPDGAAAQRTVTFAAGSATTTLTVTLDDDDLAEASGALTVQVQEGDGYTVGTPSSAAVTITDGDTGTLQPAGLAASAGPRAGEVVLTWDAVAPWLEFHGHQYRYKTGGGYESWTAIPDSGPRQPNGTGWSVSGLAAGQVHTFQVRAYETPAVGDPVYGVASDEVSATPLAGQVTLHLSGVNNAALEGDGTVTVTATVAPASATAFTVTVTASPVAPATDADFDLSTNQELSFAADATDSTGTVTIGLVNDDVAEPNDVVTVSGAVSDAAITAPADVTLTIANDDDDVRYDVAVTAPATVDEDAGTADVTVTLTTTQNSAPTIGPFLLYLPKPETATPDADYTPPPKVEGVVTTVPVAAFSQNAAGTAYVAQATFAIGIVDDSLDEADETIVFEVSTAEDRSPAHTLTITDNDDPPVVSVEDETAAEGDPLEFTVALSAVSGREVTVDWATSVEAGDTATAGTDFTAANDTLTFMPGDTTAMFTVQTTEDTTGEANETFTVTLSNPSNATLAADPTATGTITNDDTPAVSFGAGTYSVVEGGTVEVTVQLDAAPGREVVVPVSAAGAGGATPPGETGADWSGVPESVTFGATDTAQTFTLAATDDADVDPDESVALSFGTLPAGVTAGTPSEATVTIVDNDVLAGRDHRRGPRVVHRGARPSDLHADPHGGSRRGAGRLGRADAGQGPDRERSSRPDRDVPGGRSHRDAEHLRQSFRGQHGDRGDHPDGHGAGRDGLRAGLVRLRQAPGSGWPTQPSRRRSSRPPTRSTRPPATPPSPSSCAPRPAYRYPMLTSFSTSTTSSSPEGRRTRATSNSARMLSSSFHPTSRRMERTSSPARK